MALPARLLEQLPPELVEQSKSSWAQFKSPEPGLPLGIEALDAILPDRGLPRGAVVEVCVHGPGGLGTSFALAACRAAQREVVQQGGENPWCSFIDPSETLYAPGVQQAGVALEHLLVVRPELDSLSRTALKLVESQVFALVVIDTVGPIGQRLQVDLSAWTRVVRRLALALAGRKESVVLLTSADARRPLPLPVTQRLELWRERSAELSLKVSKDKNGRVTLPRSVVWARPELARDEASDLACQRYSA